MGGIKWLMALQARRVSALSREIKLGDRVLVYQDARRKWIAKVEPGRFHTHRGYFELGELVGREYGGAVRTKNRQNPPPVYAPAPPTFLSFVVLAPPIYPQEIGHILLFLCTCD